MQNKILTLLMLLSVLTISCRDDSLEKRRNNELSKFNAYIKANFADVKHKPSGLYYIEENEGTGDSIKIGDNVQIYFNIWTLDTVFIDGTGTFEPYDMTVTHPRNLGYSATLPEHLKSLNEALTYMKKGSKATLVFDSAIGYGQNGTFGLPGFTSLRMEVEVYKVFPATPPPSQNEE